MSTLIEPRAARYQNHIEDILNSLLSALSNKSLKYVSQIICRLMEKTWSHVCDHLRINMENRNISAPVMSLPWVRFPKISVET